MRASLLSLSLAVGSAVAIPQTVYEPEGPPRPTVSRDHDVYVEPSSQPEAPDNACASAASLASVASASMSNAGVPEAEATPTVPAELAYECLNSIPFNQSAAMAVLDGIKPYLDWQTTLVYVADPPQAYAENVQAPYDFMAEYERIYSTAQTGGYPSEYAFGFDLYRAFQQVHDGHFVYNMDVMSLIFSFGRETPLVSVSEDGTSTPEVFAYEDVLQASFDNSTYEPSAVVEIDGRDTTEFLLELASFGALQDPDALWNNLFYNLAQVSLGPTGTGTGVFIGGGRGQWVYPGASTTLTFANGSSVTKANFANVLVDLKNVTSPETLYTEFLAVEAAENVQDFAIRAVEERLNLTEPEPVDPPERLGPEEPFPAPGYPEPIVRHPNSLNSGYFLDDEYDDVAVLSLPSFVGGGFDNGTIFQAINTYILDLARENKKKYLILDMSANGGGTILQGYDLFGQLFPTILPFGGNRFRAFEALDLIGREVSEFTGQFERSPELSNLTDPLPLSLTTSVFNYRHDANELYEPFTSWPEKFGPLEFADTYTSTLRWNLTDILVPNNSGGIQVSGQFGGRNNITTSPFPAENIIILTDGYCASTCAIFTELMQRQAGVRSIAIGGRPPPERPMQSTGGVKGTNVYSFGFIYNATSYPFQLQGLATADSYGETSLSAYNDAPQLRATSAVVNNRDGVRPRVAVQDFPGSPDEVGLQGLPLHFLYEPADCRLLYTKEMAVDVTAMWKTVADVAFRGAEGLCVAGGFGDEKGEKDKGEEPVKQQQPKPGKHQPKPPKEENKPKKPYKKHGVRKNMEKPVMRKVKTSKEWREMPCN